MSRLYKAFQIELPLRYLFESPTIAGLAEHIETAIRTGSGLTVGPLESVSRDKDLPLSFSQQRLWLVNQLEPNNSLYNIPAAVRLTGLLNIADIEENLVLSAVPPLKRENFQKLTYSIIQVLNSMQVDSQSWSFDLSKLSDLVGT
ncbi:hypothetical protein [Nostoc mirabile]|uniref:hypothetical protein n=1 Tax=Nostoc mirabile TaxID=2907820 RepID=UPI001E4260B4